jgi:tetratricopeptide (TPR) repeat protein
MLGRLWQSGCDPFGGLLFHLMGPTITSVLGAACGAWAGVLVQRRRRALLLAFVPMGVCLAIGLWRLWADPVIYAFDPFWGYFSGSVYDEGVAVGERYAKFRAYNGLALAGALLSFALVVDMRTLTLRRTFAAIRDAERAPEGRDRRPVAQVVALASGALVAWLGTAVVGLRAAEHRFTATMESITEELGGRYETEHFVILYGARSPDDRTIEIVAAECEFAWARLKRLMGGREPPAKVTAFVFPDRDAKRSLMGAGTVQVAAPWRHQIYLDHRPFPHPVLHHELAHVFGVTIGDDIFGVSRSGLRINVGLIEGFATAMAPRASDRLDLHDQVNVMTALGRRPALDDIMGPGFFSQSSGVAYTTAGSFCQWLVDTRGFEPMATLYFTAGDFEASYGESLEALEAEWLEFLAGYEGVRPEDVESQALRFKRRSVWERPCAHRVDEVRREIGRAAKRGRFDEAVEGWEDLCGLEPEAAEHKLGLVVGLAEAQRFDDARAVLAELAERTDLTVSEMAVVFERRADIELLQGDLAAARADLEAALALPMSADQRRSLELKQFGTQHPDLAPVLVRYFGFFDTKGNPITEAITRLHGAVAIAGMKGYEALGNYLVARQLLNVEQAEAAVAHLEAAVEAEDALPSATFRTAAHEALLDACVQTKRYARAREVLKILHAEPDLGNGERLEYDLWAERIEFFEAYRP